MSLLAAVAVVATCLLLAVGLRVPALARASLDRARSALRQLRDPALGEAERERAARGHALALLVGGGRLAAAGLVAVGVPVAAILLLDGGGLLDAGAVVAWTVHPAFLAAVVGGLWLAAGWRSRSRP